MKLVYRLLTIATAVGLLGIPALMADTYVYDYIVNVNGTTYCPSGSINSCSNYGGVSAIPLAVSTVDFNTGTGSLAVTLNPGVAGTYNIDMWAAQFLSVPGFNEYATVNGSPAAGQTWQIDVPDYESDPNHTGTIISNTMADTLDNTNHVPGTTDNYNLDCGAFGSGAADPICNDNVSLALSFKFTLASSEQAVVTFDFSKSDPGGFSLEQIHPIDGNDTSASELFFSGNAVIEPACTGPNCGPPPPPIPEPASWSLLAIALGGVFMLRRRFARV